jgi:uncharacterized protein (TIGR03790 family)
MVFVWPAWAADDEAARVVVLANASNAESIQLAEAYVERRGIPHANLIALPLPMDEIVTWAQFVEFLHRPLQDELLRRGWIDAVAMDLFDEAGRRKIAVSSHRISYLVVCRGVPLAVAHEPALEALPVAPNGRAEFRTNAAAVDSELSLLAWARPPVNGWVANPLFGSEGVSLEGRQVIRVSRLDGPTHAQALALIDGALHAERHGLAGRAVFDLGGPEPMGDRWLEDAMTVARGAGFNLTVDREPATFTGELEAGTVALYFGWYAPDANGPFVAPGFRLAPGAVALHIHSLSARTLRREQEGGWTGPLVALGAAAAVGNVAEPYLQLTHRPDLFLRALVAGETLGEAAYRSLPALGWMSIVVGDPLYRPFLHRTP